MPACWHHCAHGYRRQHQHRPCHCNQVWHHCSWGGLPVSGGQGVQSANQERQGRGETTGRTVVGDAVLKRSCPQNPFRFPDPAFPRYSRISRSIVFRWSRSAWTRFGPNCVFWLGPHQQISTLLSKVGCFRWISCRVCVCVHVLLLVFMGLGAQHHVCSSIWNPSIVNRPCDLCLSEPQQRISPLLSTTQASLIARWVKPDRWWR